MNDDELMEGVRRAFEVLDPVPDEVLAAARASIAWRTPFATLAEPAHDREARPAAGVRGGTARVLTFTSPGSTVEIEVLETGRDREITGRLVPASAGEVQVRHRELPPDGITARADPDGMFWVPRVPAGLVSLVLRLEDGTSVVTSWVRL